MARSAATGRRPVHPYRVLVTALLLPGFGHVLCGAPQRGLILQAFMVLLGWITWHLTTPEHSLIGRLAGGLFIYAVSIPDAYRIAKLRYVAFGERARSSGQRTKTIRQSPQ